jgi:arylsulfatase A-like enzyme
VTEDRIEKHPRPTHQPYVFEGPEELTHTAFVAEETAGYVRRHAHELFFAIAGFYAPHAPLNPPQRFVDMYDPAEMPPPAMREGEGERFGLSVDEWKRVAAFYYALVSHVDDQVGRIISALEETGQRDNTLVIFTSDHGEHLGDHGQIGKGAPGYDSAARVPLVLSYPARFEDLQVRQELIEGVDVVPTILDYCGIQTPPVMQGRSFRPLLEEEQYEERTSAFIEHKFPFRSAWKTIRTRRYKYCVSAARKELLFDLENDPDELNDVSGDPAHREALCDARRELLDRWFDVQQEYPLRTADY